MTKNTPKSPMELDLDALLQSHATTSDTDSDDDGPNSIHRRTVDEILNDSSTSSSSSSLSSSPVRRLPPLLSPKPIPPTKIQIPETPLPIPPIPTVDESIRSPHSNDVASDLKTNASAVGRVVKPTEFSITPFTLGRSYSRPLPPLFGGVKSNPKPGAALAAAAAASRSIPTPHAAAIKFKRASSSDMLLKSIDRQESVGLDDSDGFERLGLAPDDVSIRAGSETTQSDDKLVKEDDRVENLESLMIESNLAESAEILHESDESQAIQENQAGQTVALQVDEEDSVDSDHSLDNEIHMVSDSTDVVSENSGAVENSTIFNSTTVVEELIPSAPQNQEASQLEEDSTFPRSDRHDLDANMSSDHRDGEDTNSRSDVTEIFEDISIQLESKRPSKRSGKKLRSSLKPLELAEELEKKLASSGLHWEEGAAAQPMRLEGIRRGPPAVGYLQIDPDNAITRMISSQAFRRDHGSAQVVSVHMNFIAVGMSKGTVLIVPSKYSPHHADNMDTKIMMLGSPGEKSHSPVTSMCFNQQGDLLLVGYGDGHLTVWDVQRGTTIKTITGEHTAPVVYILFLAQDSQVTRQIKAVTGDCKGLVLLHTFSVVPLLNRFSIKTQCLLDGQKGGVVLSASALLIDDLHGAGLTSAHGSATASSSGLGSMVGGVVGVVGGDAGWKLFSEGSSLVEEGVVIFVTNQTALVVRLTPSFQVYTQLVKPDGVREGSMPYTAWKCYSRGSSTEQMPMEASEKASLLAIAWDRKVQVAKLIKSELKVYKEWTLDSAAIGVAWLDDRMLVVLTVRGQLLLFAKEGTELHRTSFFADGSGGDDIITYHAHFINNFGNPEKAYHNSVAVRGATIYILGPTHLLTSRLLPWKERIQVLQKAGDWMGALDMAMRLYDGHAHGVIDLRRTVDAIQEAIMPYLVELLLSYVDEVFSYISVAFCNQVGKVEQSDESKSSTSLHSQIQEQYARVGGVAVEFCVHIKRTDILFDDIFSKFVAVQQGGTFLELLEPYILKDMLGCLPPEIMQALVEHYSSKGWLQRVEQCVLHMDISSLDFNQVVRLCREHGLYGALIYLFNRGLDDFKAPLEELLVVVQKNLTTNVTTVGYRMLVYLKYCFLGHAFPPGHGAIPSPRLPALRTELLQFLLEDSSFKDSQVAAKFKSSAGGCPNLCYLLWLDTEATLEVLRYAFPDEEPLVTEGYVNDLDDASIKVEKRLDFSNSESQNLMVQNTVSALINILEIEISEVDRSYGMDDNGSVEVWPSKKDIGHLLEFIACCVSCKGATVSKRVLNHILEFLTSDIDSSSNILSHKTQTGQKREKQVLALLKVVPETDWDSSYLLNLCEKAQFYQVCAFIYRTRGQYLAALDSYMKDEDEPVHAFVFINSLLLQLKESELSGFRLAVISKISELVSLNREGTLFLVMDHFSQESNHILSELQAHPKSLFLFLKTVIEVHLSGTLDFSSLQRGHVLDLPCGRKIKDQSRELETYLERISNFPKLLRQNSIQVTDEMAELYLELLCQYDRHSVLKFLETFENYRVEHCLRLCQEYAVTDAAAFLLERVGDVGNALLLIISDLDEKLQMLDTALETKVPEIISGVFTKKEHLNEILRMKEVHLIRDILHASIGLCQRNTPRLDQEESESLWFRLLDSFCEPLRDLYNDKKISTGTNHVRALVATVSIQEDKEASIYKWRTSRFDKGVHILQRVFSQFIREIVEGMVGYVSLPTIMAKLLSDNGGQEFGDFKLTILGMLGTYRYERRILDTAKSLIEDDTYYTMSLLKKGASHAYAPQSFTCCVCSCSLAKDCSASSIRVFNCGHVTHVLCEFQENEVLNRDNSAGCPICMPKKRTSRARSKSVLVENGLVKNSLSKPQQAQGITTPQYIHESDAVEKSYGLQQMSRFEFLSNLGKTDKPLQIETLPALRLAPPAIYHEKVKKGSDLLTGESSNIPLKSEKPSKIRPLREQKMKGSSIRFPLKSSIFGSENRR